MARPLPPPQRRLEQLSQYLRPRALPAAAGATTAERKPKLALITTVWFAGTPPTADAPGVYGVPSHAVHMGDRFLTGWPMGGQWHEPGLEVVSCYVDQRTLPTDSEEGLGDSEAPPRNLVGPTLDGAGAVDQWGYREKEFGVKTYGTIAEALRRRDTGRGRGADHR